MASVPFWCCNECTPTGCRVQKICTEDQFYAQYLSVGRPRPPKNYNGTYWAAWHNSISKKSRLAVQIDLQVIKRTLVNDGGCGGACATPSTGLGTGACGTNGTVSSTPRCKRTVYTDNVVFGYTGTMDLAGVSPDQQKEEREGGLEPVIDIPPGTYPCGLGVGCGAYFCANMNAATSFGTSPNWWAYENRKVLPRFSEYNGTISLNNTPNSTYPQLAVCGAIQRVNRCNTSTNYHDATICLDYPLVILPSYPALTCDGFTYACDPDIPQNGTNNFLIGCDLICQKLIDHLNALNMPNDLGVGIWNDFWVVKTQGRLRLLFDGRPQCNTVGSVYKPSAPITLNKTATLDLGMTSYRIECKIVLTPEKWCYKDVGCPCHQSWCEHGPSTLAIEIDTAIDAERPCSGGNTIQTTMTVGLENCYRPFGSAGWNTCYNWADLPQGASTNPAGIADVFRYLGAEPVERGHPYWVKYRSRYNHTETLNSWWSGTANDPYSLCRASRSGASISLGQYSFYVDTHEAFLASSSLCNAACAGAGTWCCSCGFPASSGSGYAWAPAGCYGSRISGIYSSCDPASPPCQDNCSGCLSTNGTGTHGSTPCGLQKCGTMSSPTVADMGCQAFYGCIGDGHFDHTHIYHVCASATFDICGLVALSGSAGLQRAIGAPDTWIDADWDPSASCSPLGTRTLYRSSAATVCEGPTSWIKGGGTITVT